jgi:18S rRNA (guanine1575-N7)-methyltransferase
MRTPYNSPERYIQVGFSGGLVVDFPNSTRAKKYFLVLMVGTSTRVPQVG